MTRVVEERLEVVGMVKDSGKRWMVTVVFTALLLSAGFPRIAGARALGDPQVKDDLFAGADKFAHGASSSTEVNLDSRMLGMAAKLGADDKDSGDLLRKLQFVIVRSYEYEKPGQYNMADVEEFQRRLETGGWSHIVKQRSAKDNTDVCVKLDADGQFSELVVIAAEPQELTFVHLKGHMSLDELTRAGAKYGVPQSTDKKDKGAK